MDFYGCGLLTSGWNRGAYLDSIRPWKAAVSAQVELSCPGNGIDEIFEASPSGTIDAEHLPYGIYQVWINKAGFASVSTNVEVRSTLPVNKGIRLDVASVVTNVNVTDTGTLIDPDSPSSVARIGSQQIQREVSVLPVCPARSFSLRLATSF